MDNVIFVTTSLIIIGWLCLQIVKTYCVCVASKPSMPHNNVTTKTIDFDSDCKRTAEDDEGLEYLYMGHMNPNLEVKPAEAIGYNSGDRSIGSEELLNLRDECKTEKFYTRDVVPKNDRKLKINFATLLMYPLKTRMWRLGITNYAEMYRKYPQYITDQEYNELELYRLELDEYEFESCVCNSVENEMLQEVDNLMYYSLEERMKKLKVDNFTELCKCFPEYVSYEEFQFLLDIGEIYSVDNIIEFRGKYFDNENSEASEWRRFRRFRDYYNKRYGNNDFKQGLNKDFPHDYYQERISDLEDMEYNGSSPSNYEFTAAVDDVLDEYSSALEEFNERR